MSSFVAPPAPGGGGTGPVPAFSIIVAAYQAATTIAHAVESALSQTVPPLEVIVIDDGSTDGTRGMLDPYIDRITYISREHRGTPAALNAGVRQASGDFVSILDADDLYETRRIEALTELAAQRPDLDILMTDAYLETGGEVVGTYCRQTPFAVAAQNLEIFERCFIAWPAVRRDVLVAAGGFDESLPVAHDWECWLRLLHAGSTAGLVDEPLMRYRIGDQSLTGNRAAALRDRVRVLELAAQLDLSADERRALARFLPSRRRRAVLAEAEQALVERRADARRLALEVALAAGMRPAVRMMAVAAALAPRVAARRLSALEAKTGYSALKRGAR